MAISAMAKKERKLSPAEFLAELKDSPDEATTDVDVDVDVDQESCDDLDTSDPSAAILNRS